MTTRRVGLSSILLWKIIEKSNKTKYLQKCNKNQEKRMNNIICKAAYV